MSDSYNDILHIPYDSIPKVLMLGNGINRAYNFASWDDLIQSILRKKVRHAHVSELPDD